MESDTLISAWKITYSRPKTTTAEEMVLLGESIEEAKQSAIDQNLKVIQIKPANLDDVMTALSIAKKFTPKRVNLQIVLKKK